VEFGKPEDIVRDDQESIWKLQRTRNEHFMQVYNADRNGYCTFESRHYPLNRAVQNVLCHERFRDYTKRIPEMETAVINRLQERMGDKLVIVPNYQSIRLQQVAKDLRHIFDVEILEDVRLCIDDYLGLRKRGMTEERGTKWFGWYQKKLGNELYLLKNGEEKYKERGKRLAAKKMELHLKQQEKKKAEAK
jgi:hypothetical protein